MPDQRTAHIAHHPNDTDTTMNHLRTSNATFLRIHAAVAALALSIGAAARAQHLGDIGLVVDGGRITTTEITVDGPGPLRRAFGAEFGAEGIPWFSTEPGFDAEAGTFPSTARVGFRLTQPLMVWNGSAFVMTDAGGPLTGERLKLSYLTLSSTSGSGPVDGFTLAVAPDGGWHRHLSMTLLPAAGAAEPQPGAYLARLELTCSDPGVGASEEIWLVIDAQSTGTDFADAFAAAEAETNPACFGDLNGDQAVEGADLGLMLGMWSQGGGADLNGDGVVGGADLGLLLGAWGPCS
jgi:hypothetical protein